MEFVRLPRFHRSSEVAPIQLTARDREIIWRVHQHRFLRSTHLIKLLDDSGQQVLRRLQLLYHHGYVARPRGQLAYYESGSRPIVYTLGHKGAALLKRERGSAFHPLDWRDKNRPSGRMFLEHALLISDVMVALELACRENGCVRLLTGKDISLPKSLRANSQPFKWNVTLKSRTKLGVIPDGAFVLEFPDQPVDQNRILYFLEADCGTMPVMRSTLAQSSFYRKLLAYEATWTHDIHRSRFGFSRFRVLTVTTSSERVKSLIQACGQLERGQGIFLFANQSVFTNQENIFRLPLQSGRDGKAQTLV